MFIRRIINKLLGRPPSERDALRFVLGGRRSLSSPSPPSFCLDGRYRRDEWSTLALEAHCEGLLDYSRFSSRRPSDLAREALVHDFLRRRRERVYLESPARGPMLASALCIPRYGRVLNLSTRIGSVPPPSSPGWADMDKKGARAPRSIVAETADVQH